MRNFEIVQIRRRAGVHQRDLAAALGLSPQRLSEMESGYIPLPKDFDGRVRRALRPILQDRLAAVGRPLA